MPFIEQQALWEQISNPYGFTRSGATRTPPWAAMGPNVWDTDYRPWLTQVPPYLCPSDPAGQSKTATQTAFNNYFACHGDAWWEQHHSGVNDDGSSHTGAAWSDEPTAVWARGAFRARHVTRFRDFLDGLANTIVAGEGVIDNLRQEAVASTIIRNGQPDFSAGPNTHISAGILDPARPRFLANPLPTGYTRSTAADRGRGRRWADGRPQFSRFNTVTAPNKFNLAHDDEGRGYFCAASRHQGGAHVLMGDGAVKFITDSIDSGDQTSPGFGGGAPALNTPGAKSPYGLWGSLGTKDSAETIEGF